MAQSPVVSAAKLDDPSWASLADAVRRLEGAWRTHPNPGLADFVPPVGNRLRGRVLVELVKVDQEYQWQSGQRQGLESYLEKWPELVTEPGAVVELLEAECLTRAVVDVVPSPEELRSRFPELWDQVDLDAVEAEAQTDHWLGTSGAGPPPSTKPAQPLEQTPPTLSTPRPLDMGGRFGRYEIRGLLGQGGMGTVYRAYDTHLGREVALKIPRFNPSAEPAVLERFVREARAAASIQHPNVCPIHDAGCIEGVYYIAMALIEGQSLAGWMKGRSITASEAAGLARKVARALDRVHALGIVHRDIKPSNVMIDPSGEPILMDFGMARQAQSDSHLTTTGSFLGTVAYMSPEQARGECHAADGRTDIYSLGVIVFELLTGELPFRGSAPMVLRQVVEDEPPSPRKLNGQVPRDLETLCLKCLEKEPRRRYPSAKALAEDLDRFLEGEPIYARPIGRPARCYRWCKRKPFAAATVALLVFLAVAGPSAAWREAFLRGSLSVALSDARTKTEELEKKRRDLETRTGELKGKATELQTTVTELTAEKTRVQLARDETNQNLYVNRVALAHQKWLDNDPDLAEELLDFCPQDLRNWEWQYLKRLCSLRLLATPRQSCPINNALFSPDGKCFASQDANGIVKLWDARTGQQVAALEEGSECLVFSPVAGRVVIATKFGRVKVWEFTSRKVLEERPGPANPLALSPDMRWVVFSNKPGCLSCAAAAPIAPAASGTTTTPSGGPRESSARDSTNDTTVQLWDVQAGQQRQVLGKYASPGVRVAFRSDGRLVAAAGDTTVRVWETATGAERVVLRHRGAVESLAFSPDGNAIASGCCDGTVNIWNLGAVWNKESDTPEIKFDGPSRYLVFAHNGRRIASADQNASVVWDIQTRDEVLSLPGTTRSIAFSLDGRKLALSGKDNVLRIWDVTVDEHEPGLVPIPLIGRPVTSPCGKLVAESFGDGTVRVSEVASGKVVCTLNEASSPIAFSPDGKHILTAGTRNSLVTWTTAGERVLTLRGHSGRISSAAYSPDGKRIVSGSVEDAPCATARAVGVVRIWDARIGQGVLMLNGPAKYVSFSGDGEQLLAWDDHGKVRAWNGRLKPEQVPSRAVEESPTTASPLASNGVTVYRAPEDAGDAIARASEAILRNAGDWEAHYQRGAAHAKAGTLDKAIDDFNTVIHLQPGNARAYGYRAYLYLLRNESQQAIADLAEAIRLNPSDAAAYMNRGGAYQKQGRLDLALADYTEAIRLRPDGADGHFNRGLVYEQTAALAAQSGSASLGEAALKELRTKAVADFSEAIKLSPTDGAFYQWRAVVYQALGEHEKAKADSAKAAELARPSPAQATGAQRTSP